MADPGVVVAIESFCCNTLSGVPLTVVQGQRLRADDEIARRFETFFIADGVPSNEIAAKRAKLLEPRE